MNYEQMILTIADNGLSSQRIHFQSTKQLKEHPEPRSLETFSLFKNFLFVKNLDFKNIFFILLTWDRN